MYLLMLWRLYKPSAQAVDEAAMSPSNEGSMEFKYLLIGHNNKGDNRVTRKTQESTLTKI